MREIRFYRLSSGRSPVEEFLDSLPGRLAQKVTWVLHLVEDLDLVPVQYLKKLEGTDDLWEIRANIGRQAARLICFFDGGRLVVLVHGFAKKSDRIPTRDLTLATERRTDYLRRRRNG